MTSKANILCLSKLRKLKTTRVPSVVYAVALQEHLEACESLIGRLRSASDDERTRLLEEHFTNASSKNGKRKRLSNTEEKLQQSLASDR